MRRDTMSTMSAAEARLDADIRPEITVLRSRSSYPNRHRQADPANRPADESGHGTSLSPLVARAVGAASAGPASAGQASAGPDATGPDAAGPDAAGPDAAGPDAAGSGPRLV